MPTRTGKLSHGKNAPSTDNAEDNSSFEEVGDEPAINESNSSSFGNLEELIFLGRIEKKVKMGNYIFTIQTLNGTQQTEVISSMMMYGEERRLPMLRMITLSHAIRDVNGVKLKDLYKGKDANVSDAEKALSVVQGLQIPTLDRLFAEYDELITEANESVAGDSVKK